VGGTLGDREEGCQGHYCSSSRGLLMQLLPTYEKGPDQQYGEWPVRRWGERTVRHQSAYRCCLETKSTVTNDEFNQTC
jgi:hypothetical protein